MGESMEDKLKGKVVLVTGGTGSIGNEIAKQILNCGVRKVVIFARDERENFWPEKKVSDERVKTILGDIRDKEAIHSIFKRFKIGIIYHTAGIKYVPLCENFPAEAVEINLFGTKNIVDIAGEFGVKHLIAISTDKAAHPVSVMGATKLIAERVVLNANYSCVRLGNVANSHGSVIPLLINNLLQRKPLKITDPDVTRFIMKIPEAAKWIFEVTRWIQGGEIFILKMRAFRLGDLLDVITERIAPRLEIPREDIAVEVIGLAQGEKKHEILINETEVRRVYEVEGIYVVLSNASDTFRYSHIKKIDLPHYSSQDAPLISHDEIEEIVNSYLAQIDESMAVR